MGAAPPAAHVVAGYSPSGVPTQSGPRGGRYCQGLGRCGVGGNLGTPVKGNRGGGASGLLLLPTVCSYAARWDSVWPVKNADYPICG